MAIIYLNGEYLTAEEAKISVYDHGFLYGDGLFETMRSYGGRIFCWEDHWQRLSQGANILKLFLPWSREELAQALAETLRRNNLEDAYIRLTVSRGPGAIGLDPDLCPRPTLVIMAKPLGVREEIYQKGVRVAVVSVPRYLESGTKSLNFLNNILAKIEAKEKGAYEGIMLNNQGYLTEGTVSNLFWSLGDKLYTPALTAGLLPGVTRAVVQKMAREAGLSWEEGHYTVEALYGAEEVFLTNSGSELVPVIEVDNHPIADGKPGARTLVLLNLYRQKTKGF